MEDPALIPSMRDGEGAFTYVCDDQVSIPQMDTSQPSTSVTRSQGWPYPRSSKAWEPPEKDRGITVLLEKGDDFCKWLFEQWENTVYYNPEWMLSLGWESDYTGRNEYGAYIVAPHLPSVPSCSWELDCIPRSSPRVTCIDPKRSLSAHGRDLSEGAGVL